MTPKRILIVGSGGREHALAWRLCGPGQRLWCAPGNPGMAALPDCTCVPLGALDIDGLCALARREACDLVVVGPEAPLSAGLADALLAACGAGTAVFGCSARAAEIEASKVFAKGFLQRHRIPTAAYQVLRGEAELAGCAWPEGPVVVKADGLCGGKGVTLCAGPAAAQAAARALLAAGGAVVVEEFLRGREASCMALVDGESVRMLPPCEDHKTLGDGDTGPMTGGMGALCPTPVLSAAALARVRDEVLVPAARGLLEEGRPFRGLLYAGLMMTAAGPKVLEFNCRFGDPETQPLMMGLRLPEGVADLGALLAAVGRGRLAEVGEVPPPREAALCVVMAARGYPDAPQTGDAIALPPELGGDVVLFHAGTALRAGALVTAGGRVLGVTARGADVAEARRRAYAAAAQVRFEGAQVRRDIGAREGVD